MEGFPGAPLEESANGNPATHTILSRLGLIKHAEEAIHDPQEILAEISDYLRSVLSATDCTESTESTEPSEPTLSGDPSPEPGTPRDTLEQLVSPTSENHCMWGVQAMPQALSGSYPMYDCLEVMPQQQPSISHSMTGISYQESTMPSHIIENTESCNSRYSFSNIPCQRNDPSAAFAWPIPYQDAANLLPINMSGTDYRIPVQGQQTCSASHLFHGSDSISRNR
ncbi:hypothetical protein VTN77DRAFT_7953 [Rasamsonia byssochlamydoides]|uniref:uncharacterized protein n=1 Tax=Rasamsonia byssochlamydoides TaxID=89139 RepID=UPI00374316C0